jgi:signal transduction histidine kinase
VHAIATAHEGRVDIESSPFDGTTFTIAVPTDQLEREGLPA